jgi:exopolysaccharide biosynthesis WecB/TagA/CpsF family protein
MMDRDITALKPLHVAFYMQDLSSGGVERMRLMLIGTLRRKGLRITLVLAVKSGPLLSLLPAGLDVVGLGQQRTIHTVASLIRFLREQKPDILVSSLDHNNIAAMLACRLSGGSTRLVICQHNALSAERILGWKYRLVPWAYHFLQRQADGIVAVSQGVADDLSAIAGIARRKISVIYNPVIDQGFWERANRAAPHHWLAQKDRPVFVFVGRLTAQKDLFTLFAAMKIVLQHSSVRLIVLGEGEDEPALRRYANAAAIEQAIAFVGFQANPLPWIKHADALVLSSRYEGLGNVIVEALACGTSVIATNCPHGPAEVLLGGTLGRLVPVGNPGALAEAILDFDTSSFDTAQLQARSEDFSAESCAAAHVDLFENIMSGRGRIVHALGIGFSPLRSDEVAEAIAAEIVREGVNLVVTPNLDHVCRLRHPDFAAAYASARLVCPDGLPVLLYARVRGLKLRRRVTGCDIFARLIRHMGIRRHRIFIVVESRATAAAALLWANTIGLADRISIAVAPRGLDADERAQADLVQRIGMEAPTLLVLTLGAPVSEIFVHRYRHALPPCWALCVGQALRVEMALTRRAPALWQAFGMEWLWRLAHEPRRLLGRYARALAWFPVAIWRDFVQGEGLPRG